MQLNQQISELLYHYDCVIIPQFGGFITNYKPAHLDERLHWFHPPSKEVSFNKNLTRNDGILAQHLSEMGDYSFEEANALIKKNVEDYFAKLNNGERVVFNKVGIIYRDSDKNLRFQPSREENFLKDAFGLEKLFAVPVEEPEKEQVQKEPVKVAPVIPMPQPVASSEPEESIEENRWPRRWAWAAVLTLPLLAYSGWLISTADLSRPANLTIADLNPFKSGQKALYAERNTVFEPAENFEESNSGAEWLNNESDVVKGSFTDPPGEGVYVRLKEASTPSIPVNTYVATPEILALRYHVVGGCFGELGNARGLVDDLRQRGYQAYILDHHKGLYRVTFGNYERRKDALTALRKVKNEEMQAAWLLVQ